MDMLAVITSWLLVALVLIRGLVTMLKPGGSTEADYGRLWGWFLFCVLADAIYLTVVL